MVHLNLSECIDMCTNVNTSFRCLFLSVESKFAQFVLESCCRFSFVRQVVNNDHLKCLCTEPYLDLSKCLYWFNCDVTFERDYLIDFCNRNCVFFWSKSVNDFIDGISTHKLDWLDCSKAGLKSIFDQIVVYILRYELEVRNISLNVEDVFFESAFDPVYVRHMLYQKHMLSYGDVDVYKTNVIDESSMFSVIDSVVCFREQRFSVINYILSCDDIYKFLFLLKKRINKSMCTCSEGERRKLFRLFSLLCKCEIDIRISGQSKKLNEALSLALARFWCESV